MRVKSAPHHRSTPLNLSAPLSRQRALTWPRSGWASVFLAMCAFHVGTGSRASRATSWTTAGRIIAISARRRKLAGCSIDNTPTIFNAVLNFRFSWSGQFRDLAEQNSFVLQSPKLMNTNWTELIGKLRTDTEYSAGFDKAYGGPLDAVQVLDALASYERSLVTPNARFDRYLRGERDAITPEEEKGYHLFKAFGCVACHQGRNVGGNLFERFGIFEAPPMSDGANRPSDLGRFAVTGQERDRFVFRVPSLRNIALTAPYFHDGSAATLGAAVNVMARKQLGRTLEDAEVGLLVGFLKTLTGEYLGRPLDRPTARDKPMIPTAGTGR